MFPLFVFVMQYRFVYFSAIIRLRCFCSILFLSVFFCSSYLKMNRFSPLKRIQFLKRRKTQVEQKKSVLAIIISINLQNILLRHGINCEMLFRSSTGMLKNLCLSQVSRAQSSTHKHTGQCVCVCAYNWRLNSNQNQIFRTQEKKKVKQNRNEEQIRYRRQWLRRRWRNEMQRIRRCGKSIRERKMQKRYIFRTWNVCSAVTES